MNKQFDHIGIPTDIEQENEIWLEKSQCWITNPRLHPHRIEYIRRKEKPKVDPSNIGLWRLFHQPHVAYRVDDIEAAVVGEEVLREPSPAGNFGRIAFIHKDELVVEYIEYTDLNDWFGQKTPWKSTG